MGKRRLGLTMFQSCDKDLDRCFVSIYSGHWRSCRSQHT